MLTVPNGSKQDVLADDSGAFTTTWKVPAGHAAGLATFNAEGESSGRTADASVTVLVKGGLGGSDPVGADQTREGSSGSGSKLAVTGVDLGAVAPLGALLLLMGAGVFLASRRKGSDVSSV